MAHKPTPENLLQPGWIVPLLAFVLIAGVCAATVGVPEPVADPVPAAVAVTECPTTLKVMTAASFAGVVPGVAPAVASGPDCARLEVVVADGRTAADQMAEQGADVWIPDDPSWVGIPGRAQLAAAPAAGAGTVVAVSPFYLVTDRPTAERVTAEGGGWLGLSRLVTKPEGNRSISLAMRDPAGSGDGMMAAGAVGEAVWNASGMDASAAKLAEMLPVTRSVPESGPALPGRPREVGLVPEYALLPALRDATAAADLTVLAPTDNTAALRYSWQPSAAAAADPVRAGALARLLGALGGNEATAALDAAGLRRPGATAAPGAGTVRLPATTAPMFGVLKPHHVDHVFATWYPNDRLADVLVAVDVSGSMNARAPGSTRPVIDLVKDGFADLGTLLPDDSRLGLWEFGAQLAPPRDYEVLLPVAALDPEHRGAMRSAIAGMRARKTGTGLYDTILAAYGAARDRNRPGVPNYVVVFTDGRNESDPGSMTRQQLAQRLAQATDPQRPVQLTVLTFGDEPEAALLKQTLEPVKGYVSQLTTADQVGRAFLHVAAGGLHG